ncbi:MAG: hypothetical protein KGM47_09455 [Acidobacteriota bacterium]|nr:hypothetical protein [Acidobacteriota bacterium]
MAANPTNEQAQLQLQVYEQRREARLREARTWFFVNFHPESLEEAMKFAGPGTENGALFSMVVSYWEQACALLNYGLLHEDLFFQTSGEFFAIWELVRPIVPQARQTFINAKYLANMEKAAQRYEAWIESHSPGHVAGMRQWMKQMRTQTAASAKA